ncbi:hypothetical protein H0W91_03320 [Patescibacteria group bacterium]|nr:hypothetical protein [Patescibacteria group bacterium]
MSKLHNKPIDDNIFVPKEGERGLLCSNKKSFRSPSFGIETDLLLTNENVALDYLASILVEAFLDKKEYEHNQSNKSKEGGNLLPSIN